MAIRKQKGIVQAQMAVYYVIFVAQSLLNRFTRIRVRLIYFHFVVFFIKMHVIAQRKDSTGKVLHEEVQSHVCILKASLS